MKIKIITFFVLVIIFAPAVSRGMAMAPFINLTTVVNTQGQNALFHFNLDTCSGVFCNSAQQFDVQTQNLSASNLTNLVSFGDSYVLTETAMSGYKVDSISCTSDNPNSKFSYNNNIVNFTTYLWSSVSCTFNNVKVQTKTPILIVPGILGTNIDKDRTRLWLDLSRNLTDISDSFMDSLQFDKNLSPVDFSVNKTNVIGDESANVGLGKIVLFDYTSGLKQELNNQGYVENQDLFTFPYDWRYGVSGKYSDGSTNEDLLGEKIQGILAQTGGDHVDVIAHSLGGLIVKKYVMDNPAGHHIGKAVFVGVPETGSLKVIKALLQGDNFGVVGLNDQEMKKIAANMPSVYDLLPDQQYYNTAGSFVSQINIGYGLGVSEPTEKDLSYSDFTGYLNGKGFNSTALANSQSLHTAGFDNFDMRTAGVNLYAIDGCKTGTMGNFLEVTYKDILGNSHTDYDNVEVKPGDGTVPLESSTNLPVDAGNKYYALVSNHSKMPSEDGIRQEIVNLLAGSALPVNSNIITQDINRCQLNGKAISVFSPVNIFATDQNGNRIGLNDDGSVINEIPGADFELLGEHKFLYLPQDNGQLYNINLNGTAVGAYTIKSQNIANGQVAGTEVFSNLPVTTALTGQVNINPTDNSTTLSIKQNPAGQSSTIFPSSTLNANASQDVLPPVVTAKLDGDLMKPGVYRRNIEVKIKAVDKNSGVLAVQYNLDGRAYKKLNKDNVEVDVDGEGSHTVTFFATDKAGNNSPEQSIKFEIKKWPKFKDECKNNGWRSFSSKFKNQGDCAVCADK